MKRTYVNKWISVLLVGCCLMQCVACTQKPDSSNNLTDSSNNNSGKTEYTLVKDGKTNYVVVVPANSTLELVAAQTFTGYLQTATTCRMQIQTDAEYVANEQTNVISFGETTLYKQTDLHIDRTELNGDGYVIKNVGEDIYVVAGPNANAYTYSAYQLLHETIAFEPYSYDEISYNVGNTVKYEEIDLTDIPDFEFRNSYNFEMNDGAETALYWSLLRKSVLPASSYGLGHTCFKFLPPEVYYERNEDWYTNTGPDGQLCWTNQEMIKELAVQVIKHIESEPETVKYVQIAQNDFTLYWCTCSDCLDSKNKYGTDSAAVIKAINYVCDEVKKAFPEREIYIGTFAYTATEVPPVKENANGQFAPIDDSVKMRDNSFVQIAPINTDYSKDYADPSNEVYAKNIKGWGAISENIIVWNYNENFNFYFVPFLPYDTIQNIYQFFKDSGTFRIMEQGCYNSRKIGFVALKNYISQKLMWDIDQNMETLIDGFFENYYKEGSVAMRKYFDEYRAWFNVLKERYAVINGGIYCNFDAVPDAFPESLINRWDGYFNEAKEEIAYLKEFDEETYNKLYERIDMESLFVDYVRCFRLKEKYSEQELRNYRISFKEKCERYGIIRIYEHASGGLLADEYKSWGL